MAGDKAGPAGTTRLLLSEGSPVAVIFDSLLPAPDHLARFRAVHPLEYGTEDLFNFCHTGAGTHLDTGAAPRTRSIEIKCRHGKCAATVLYLALQWKGLDRLHQLPGDFDSSAHGMAEPTFRISIARGCPSTLTVARCASP